MIDKGMNAALSDLSLLGWSVRLKERPALSLNADFARRYAARPADYASFLSMVERCCNATETAWFLCESDFNGAMLDTAFHWNEWERISLEAALADKDVEWAENIRSFWNHHLPILLSVKNGYAFAALSLLPENYGAVVVGFEPEFEEVETVALSLTDFLDRLVEAVRDGGEALNRLHGFV